MAKGEQDLTLKADAKGFDQAAAEVDKVADAESRLKGQVEGGGKAASEAAKSQEKLNASESDYVGILSQINPQLGALLDGFLKSGKVAGDLASQQINLSGAFKKASAAIKGNAAALKLIGAGGAVVLAIFAIVKALEKMKQEAEAATKALKAQTDALNELQRQGQGRQQAIENISDARGIGGFNADQARSAANTARAIGEQFEGLDADAINQVAGLAGDAGLSKEQLAKAAFLLKTGRLTLNPKSSREGFRSAIENAIGRHGDPLGIFFGRETDQGQGLGIGGERASDAFNELNQEGGSTVAIQDFARQFTPEGADLDRLARLAVLLRGGGLDQRSEQIRRAGGALKFPGLGEGEQAVPAHEVSLAFDLVERIERAVNVRSSSDSGGGPTITINDNTSVHHNGRYFGLGAQGQRKRSQQEKIERR